MKRLLAYLFIVLGLGLTFNVNVHAYVLEACVQNPKFDSNLKKEDLTVTVSYSSSAFKKIKKKKNNCEYFTGSKHKNFRNALTKNVQHHSRFRMQWYPKGWDWKGKTYYSNYEYILKSWGLESKIYIPEKPKTQIAKAEPSQTQKVAKKEFVNLKFCKTRQLKHRDVYVYHFHVDDGFKCRKVNTGWWGYGEPITVSYSEYRDMGSFNSNKNKYQPGEPICYNTKLGKYILDYDFQLMKFDTLIMKQSTESLTSQINGIVFDISKGCQNYNKEKNDNFVLLNHYKDNEFFYYKNDNQTQIAKAEPTVKPKKKVKVAKVTDSTQEEFKPKKTNQDNEAPVIEIAEVITVDSQAYTLKGKVKDKSQIYLTIDGRQVDVSKGKFELDRFSINSDATEEIKIVAIDKWNNRSEKIVKVTIDLQSSTIVKVYEQLKPNNIKVKTDNNKIAIIIGIEKYENLTNLDAKYANRDAQAFRTYATRALGIKPSNIKMLIDEKATRSQALKAFKLWLPKIAGKGGKDIHIFFAGHGLASDNGEDLYILPQDGESSLLEDTAISRVELISLINKVNPRSVTMFFDTCYSGQTRDERMLVASLRPIRIVADEQETPDNFTIFTASNYDQTSGSIEEAEHGMFSYYLMKGLEGKADENGDRKITNGELIAYLKDNVSQEAFTQNREQDPMLAGDPDKILMSYR